MESIWNQIKSRGKKVIKDVNYKTRIECQKMLIISKIKVSQLGTFSCKRMGLYVNRRKILHIMRLNKIIAV